MHSFNEHGLRVYEKSVDGKGKHVRMQQASHKLSSPSQKLITDVSPTVEIAKNGHGEIPGSNPPGKVSEHTSLKFSSGQRLFDEGFLRRSTVSDQGKGGRGDVWGPWTSLVSRKGNGSSSMQSVNQGSIMLVDPHLPIWDWGTTKLALENVYPLGVLGFVPVDPGSSVLARGNSFAPFQRGLHGSMVSLSGASIEIITNSQVRESMQRMPITHDVVNSVLGAPSSLEGVAERVRDKSVGEVELGLGGAKMEKFTRLILGLPQALRSDPIRANISHSGVGVSERQLDAPSLEELPRLLPPFVQGPRPVANVRGMEDSNA